MWFTCYIKIDIYWEIRILSNYIKDLKGEGSRAIDFLIICTRYKDSKFVFV